MWAVFLGYSREDFNNVVSNYGNGIIKCLYSPEDSGEYWRIEYDVAKDEYVLLKQTKYKYSNKFYNRNIKNKLREIEGAKEIKSEYKLVIY